MPFNCTLHYYFEVNFNDKEQMRCQFLRICGLKTMVAQTRKDLLMFRSEKAASKPAYRHPHPPSPPEHLPPVPRHKPLLGITFFPLRQGNRLTIKIPE